MYIHTYIYIYIYIHNYNTIKQRPFFLTYIIINQISAQKLQDPLFKLVRFH